MNLKPFFSFKDWYTKSSDNLIKIFGSEDISLIYGLISATSPRKSVKANLNLTKKLYKNYLLDEPIFKGIAGILPAHKGNILRVLNGLELSGNKVKSFYLNLIGDLNAVTIDTWVLKYFGLEDMILTAKRYRDLTKRIKANARRHGLKPAEYQAVIWTAIRDKHGFKPVQF